MTHSLKFTSDRCSTITVTWGVDPVGGNVFLVVEVDGCDGPIWSNLDSVFYPHHDARLMMAECRNDMGIGSLPDIQRSLLNDWMDFMLRTIASERDELSAGIPNQGLDMSDEAVDGRLQRQADTNARLDGLERERD